MSVQLASYEANSAALMGDSQRARDALDRSELIAQALTAGDDSGSPWAFPAQRRAIFRLSVLLRTADPEGALRAAAEADQTWAAGEPQIAGTWAQVRIGAAIAHLQQGQLDGTAEDIEPVLAMAPEMRIATVTAGLTTWTASCGPAGMPAVRSLSRFGIRSAPSPQPRYPLTPRRPDDAARADD